MVAPLVKVKDGLAHDEGLLSLTPCSGTGVVAGVWGVGTCQWAGVGKELSLVFGIDVTFGGLAEQKGAQLVSAGASNLFPYAESHIRPILSAVVSYQPRVFADASATFSFQGGIFCDLRGGCHDLLGEDHPGHRVDVLLFSVRRLHAGSRNLPRQGKLLAGDRFHHLRHDASAILLF